MYGGGAGAFESSAVGAGVGWRRWRRALRRPRRRSCRSTQRLEDRREVAAGTRAQVLGFQDGRFYANGWHITGEMGGIVTPPLKLLDSVSFRVNGTWVGPATRVHERLRATSATTCPSIDGHRGSSAPTSRPTAGAARCSGSTLTNPRRTGAPSAVMVDAHSELMTQYPWGFAGVVAERERQRARHAAPSTGAGSCSATRGGCPGEARDALLHRDRRLQPRRRVARQHRPGPLRRRSATGARCAADQTPAPMPSECDDGPFGRGTGGRLALRLRVPGHGSRDALDRGRRLGELAAPRRADELDALTDPARAAAGARSAPRAPRLGAPHAARRCRATSAGRTRSSGASRTSPTSPRSREDLEMRWTNQGKQWSRRRASTRMRWVGAGFPDYPWLFGVDGEYTAHASVTLGQFEPIKDHMRALRDISDHAQRRLRRGRARGRRGRLDLVRQGPRGTTRRRATRSYDFNTDEIVKFPAAVALIWRWTGDDALPRRDARLHAAQPRVRAHASSTRTATAGPRATATSSGRAWARRSSTTPSTTSARSTTTPTWRASRGQTAEADEARRAADGAASALRGRLVDRGRAAVRRLAAPTRTTSRSTRSTGSASTRWRPSSTVDGEFVPGLAPFEHGSRGARDAREQLLQRRAARQPRPVPHRLRRRPGGRGRVRHLLARHRRSMAVGEGNYGRLGADAAAALHATPTPRRSSPSRRRAGRPTSSRARCRRSSRRSRRERRRGTPPNIDRCWTCRSMFMQAWGHYGTAWSVVHQQLGVRPTSAATGSRSCRRCPTAQPRVQRRTSGSATAAADVLAVARRAPLHDEGRRDRRAGCATLLDRPHAAARRRRSASVELDGRRRWRLRRAAHEPRPRGPGRADPGGVHTLVVTAG